MYNVTSCVKQQLNNPVPNSFFIDCSTKMVLHPLNIFPLPAIIRLRLIKRGNFVKRDTAGGKEFAPWFPCAYSTDSCSMFSFSKTWLLQCPRARSFPGTTHLRRFYSPASEQHSPTPSRAYFQLIIRAIPLLSSEPVACAPVWVPAWGICLGLPP